MESRLIDTDVLIIGAGVAGLRTAIEVASRGVDCLVVGRGVHGSTHSRWAGGGINAALGNLDAADHWTIHAADTLREGYFICDPKAVELLAFHAPQRVRELDRWGCPFEKTGEGKIAQRLLGAQTFGRTCYVGDQTGEAVLKTLVQRAALLEVKHLESVYIAQIAMEEGRARGALGWDTARGERLVFSAKAVVLAMGGATSLYQRSSSGLFENTGDAIALAARAGATLRDLEFVQFHPTGMLGLGSKDGIPVTEAVRGEGGRLYNAAGERFMERYAPRQMELAPRDRVARAIAQEIRNGKGTEQGGVYLDISHRGKDFILERLPALYERYQAVGIDITREPMEVAPTAHYSMGGVQVDFETGATDVDGLFAVGEATAGVHGANPLGGNSLTEALVFGQLTGEYLADWVQWRGKTRWGPARARPFFEGLERRAKNHGQHAPQQVLADLQDIMERRAGILRRAEGLAAGIDELEKIRWRAQDLRVYTTVGSSAFQMVYGLESMIDVAEMILHCALRRRESRGAHYREDFPETDRNWQVSLLCTCKEPGEPETFTRAIGEVSQEVLAVLK